MFEYLTLNAKLRYLSTPSELYIRSDSLGYNTTTLPSNHISPHFCQEGVGMKIYGISILKIITSTHSSSESSESYFISKSLVGIIGSTNSPLDLPIDWRKSIEGSGLKSTLSSSSSSSYSSRSSSSSSGTISISSDSSKKSSSSI